VIDTLLRVRGPRARKARLLAIVGILLIMAGIAVAVAVFTGP
jgi:hypothetical protein